MEELYWISVLGAVHEWLIPIMALGIIALVMGLIVYISLSARQDPQVTIVKKWVTKIFVVCLISSLGVIFIPSRNTLLAIWGVGGTIDYLKNNPTAKQLPDKCINLLDKWVEAQTDSIK